ncbi:MAG: hypothetical protein PVG90_05835 [Bacillota bacterium]|jgi:hypothetical protein
MAKLVSAKELAVILGITDRHVNRVAEKGSPFQRDISGMFEVPKCVDEYFKEKYYRSNDELDLDRERALSELSEYDPRCVCLGYLSDL